ncbi:MAG: type II 3-dehydroquinate dehydratase [Verrucomicrobiota bacterium]|nr:type II 3-dehydroquinate dehydratase [Verrucomicrobiota bacterium]
MTTPAENPARPLVFILNGPNLDLLGDRQPEIYGRETLEELQANCERRAEELGLRIEFRQTNSEGTLVDHIHDARAAARAIIINPAAYAHTSIAVLDALLACEMPIMEVHISNPATREDFRHIDYTARAATGVINGCGTNGYLLALQQVATLLKG